MKLAVIGSKTFTDYDTLSIVLDELRTKYKITVIVSGGCVGADKLAEIYAKDNNIITDIYPAEWDKYGKGAGFIRNKIIWDIADFGIAFWDGKSKGTSHSFKISEKQSKPLYIFDFVKNHFYMHDKLKTKLSNLCIF